MPGVGKRGVLPSYFRASDKTLKHPDKLLFHNKFLRIGARKEALEG